MPILLKLKKTEEGTLPNSFDEVSITLKQESDKNIIRKIYN